jgi:gamma-glutamyltranspeptidase/glutathione hydrolase
MKRVIVCLAVGCAMVAGGIAARGEEPGSAGSHPFLAEGRSGMVVGLTGKRAVHAGFEVLKDGGSAADAAMATAMTQIVEVAGSYISFAGILSMVYYDAGAGQYHYLNAGYNTPVEETDPLSIPRMDTLAGTGTPSGRTVLVPGFMAGVQAARDRFGKVPMARIVAPAIALADDGLEIDPLLGFFIQYRHDVLGRLSETKRIFTRKDGAFYKQGDRLRQPELAATLRHVADKGAGVMYTGDWARRFVEAVRREGGKLTMSDLESYRVTWEAPIETTYRGARVVVPGFSSRGGVDTAEALNLLERANLGPSGPPAKSPESLFWLMQITRNQALFESPETLAKRFPGRDLSPRARTTKEHAQWLWERMKHGDLPYAIKPSAAPRHSSGVVAVDQWGNVAAVTHSINTVLWGNTGLFVDGVSIPDSAAFQQKAIKEVGPGRRLPEPMTPLIIARDGKPILACTAIGGGLHQRTIQVLAGVLEFGQTAQAAVDAPAFLIPDWTDAKSVAQVPAKSFDTKVLDGVRSLGQEVRELGIEKRGMFVGYWAGIAIDPQSKRLHGAGTAEQPSYGEGY